MENKQINPQTLPNSTAVLVLGILSIITCFCYGFVGVTLGIIALVLSSKANKLYALNSEAYTDSSYKNMKAGKVCAIIGLCISSLYFLIVLFYILILGVAFSAMPWNTLL